MGSKMNAEQKLNEIKAIVDSPTDTTPIPIVEAEITPNWDLYPNFVPKEFVCKCGTCEQSNPEYVRKHFNPNTLAFLQFLRKHYGKAVNITCGSRCQKHNDSLVGSSKTSKHLTDDAVDFYISGITNTASKRTEIVNLAKQFPGYRYAYHNSNGQYPNMGSAVHADFVR